MRGVFQKPPLGTTDNLESGPGFPTTPMKSALAILRICQMLQPRSMRSHYGESDRGQEMEGVIKGHTFWLSHPLYGSPVISLGSGPSEAVKAVLDFLLMMAYTPGFNGIAMLDMGVREVGT